MEEPGRVATPERLSTLSRVLDPRFALEVGLGTARVLAGMVGGRARPFVVNHFVTVRCNLACPHCYVSGPEQVAFNRERYPRRSEMDTDEMRAFYTQLVREGFKL